MLLLKKHLFLVLLIAWGTEKVVAQKPLEYMFPKKEFNIRQATEMLNDGTAEIKGVAFYEDRTPLGIKVGETIYARLGIVVTLLPLTEYMEEYTQLKKKNKPGKKVAAISSLAWCYRIESKVYSNTGDFVFKGLRPGKYYLESMVHFPSGATAKDVEAIVEITKDGESLNVKLKHIF